MDFKLDIGELTNTIRDYENFINILAEQKENINKTVKELTDLGWSGAAKDQFEQNHAKKQEFYTKLEEDFKYVENAMERDEKPRAIQLKKRCEDFENCIKRSAGVAALTNDDTGIISLQYSGQALINNNVDECINNHYKKMDSKFVEIQNLLNSLTFTSFPIGEDVEKARKSLKDQTTSLTDFNDSFNAYCNGVRDMEENICSVFSKISGITEGISQIRGMSIISESGQVDKNKVMQLMLKNPAYLTIEEKEILEYAKIVLGEDEYKKIKETVFTYEEAEKYIKCDILGLNVGLKAYSSNEISNLPNQITYEKGGYIYTYVLTENSPPTFNGLELPNDDIITKDGQVISTKTYGYKLAYTNEPKISTGIVFVSPTKWVAKAETISHPVLEYPRGGSGLKNDPYHDINDIIDNYAKDAQRFDLPNKKGHMDDLYQIEGSIIKYKTNFDKVKNNAPEMKQTKEILYGVFEWVVDPTTKTVTHRTFIPGGTVSGKINQWGK